PERSAPGAVIRDPAETRNEIAAALDVSMRHARLTLVDHRLVEAGAPATGLIYDITGHSVPDEVWVPTFAPVGSGLEACSRMRRPVHHDHRPSSVVFLLGDLELHIHLTDGDLLRCRGRRRRFTRCRRRWHNGMLSDFLKTPDEEAAPGLDGT